MDQFMDDDDSGEEIEISSDQDEFATEDLFVYGDPFAIPISSDESNQAIASNDISDMIDYETTNITQEQMKLINEFNSDFSKKLSQNAGNEEVCTLLNKHLQTYVPLCFNVSDNPLKNLNETDSQRILLQPLEVFLCNSQNSEQVLRELNQLEEPSQLCGKVFKAGEPSYFCRDCGSDPTCVLCSNCFRNSKHRNHKYKMMTSGGGGYCDCGDPEAWKQHPNCELHLSKEADNNKTEESIDDYENKLPKDFIERATQMFNILLNYVFEMLNDNILPSHLKPDTETDDYVTMLYNDEVHSYEDVTGTLRKVLGIDDKKALEYAAIVDKEGRSTIKRGKKADCQAIKEKVEKRMGGPQKDPLETKVLHHSLVSHQYFAEKILIWLQKICDSSKGLKHILCKLSMLKKEDANCLVEKFMLSDTKFWKSARSIIHQFYISIYFMDPNWKKEFAVIYTLNYKNIWRNYVKNPDDTVSLTDLAVQMFTVISLSKYLIAKHNLIQIIMETLIEHSKTSKGKLNFPRNRPKSNPEFKRAQFILYDLKYCLTCVPDKWTDELRKNFIFGFKSFVDFIKFMHGMDSLRRQTQQHIEYEPEWETSFNLLIKLQKPITAIIEWCSSDRIVYIECYKYLLHTIYQVESNDQQYKFKFEKIKFEDSNEYEIINCSVLKQEISIHAPLTRLFAAIYTKIGSFSLDYNTMFEVIKESTSQSPVSVLKHDLYREKMIALLEPSLRALVLVSQTNNGLWKRNGFSLLSQVYFYSNIKCRHDMFDRDILCLQMGASIMESNEFIVNLLTHYNLFEYFMDSNFDMTKSSNFPDELKQVESFLPIAEDFLELLIYIISERYDPDLSEIEHVNKIEREVIQQLCISAMPHSDLVKNIYSDNEKFVTEKELNTVLNRIAIFKNPRHNSNEKGVYELKEEYLQEYSPYFYHYVKSEKTKSEEKQLNMRKLDNEKFFKAGNLPKLRSTYANIEHLLDSDIFVRIVINILQRCVDKSKLHSDGQLTKILHLIGIALHREKKTLDTENKSEFLEKAENKNLVVLLKKVVEITTTEQYRLLTMWTLEYIQSVKDQKYPIKNEPSEIQMQCSESDQSIKTTKSSSPEGLSDKSSSIQKEYTKRKNLLAEKRRAKILAQLNKQQKNFIQKNKVFFDETKTQTFCSASEAKVSDDINMNLCDQEDIVCIGKCHTLTNINDIKKKTYQCILCQEEEEISFDKKPMVLCCFVQYSKVLSKNRETKNESTNPLFFKNTLDFGINTNSCGHVMCAPCWQKYVDTFRLVENRRHTRYLSYNVKEEFLCPLCETVGNSVMPIFPDFRELTKHSSAKKENSWLSYEDWLDGLVKTLDNSVKKEFHEDKDVFIINPCPLSTITKLMADAVAYNFKSLFEFDSFTHMTDSTDIDASNESKLSLSKDQAAEPKKLSEEIIDIMQNFNKITFMKLLSAKKEASNKTINNFELSKPLSFMISCAYTIQCLEKILTIESKCLFDEFSVKHSNLLSNIVKQSALSCLYPPFKPTNEKELNSVRENCVRLMAAILPYETKLFDSQSIVDIDMFHFLVNLCLSMPNLYHNYSNITFIANWQINYFNILKLCLQAHCVQIILIKIKNGRFIINDSTENVTESEEEKQTFEMYNYLLKWYIKYNKSHLTEKDINSLNSISSQSITQSIKTALMPFLRNCALFFSNLTDLTPSQRITSNPNDLCENFKNILKFLGFTDGLNQVININTSSLKKLCDFWLSNINSMEHVVVDYPMEVNKLIELPNDYVDLISMSMSSNVCRSKSTSNNLDTSESAIPTYICLICGEKLCGQTFCCLQEIGNKRVGSCTAHANKCGKNVGMFIRVAECQVLLLHLDNSNENLIVRGCFFPAPYIDDYGETDQYLKRGNPLHLCHARYQKLYKDWLTHSIPDVISRKYPSDSGIYHTDWIQL